MSEEHVHKFNMTLIRWHGRCSCGAWSRWSKFNNPPGYGPPFTHEPTIKGLETRLAKFKDPEVPVRVQPYVEHGPDNSIFKDYHPQTIPDTVEVFEGKRKFRG